MSFLRSVMVMNPSSSISAMSPVRSQPSSREHLAGRLRVLEVAGEDGFAPQLELAVLGEAHLHAGSGLPTVPNLKASGRLTEAAVVHSVRP